MTYVQLSIKLFGPDRRAIGADELPVEVPRLPITCAELRKRIAEVEPRLAKSLGHARIAVNCDFAAEDALIQPGDELAIIANVCGG
ncbi:MAG: MoaD/ThiS family protein [Tepidisphaeraceae bacterium]|jgi:molybdopterin converting factor small subunit